MVLISTVIMYVLVDLSIDPLDDLRTSTAPNKAEQIANRIAELNLDDPVLLRYLCWLQGASGCLYGNCDLGENWRTHQEVTSLLSGAVVTTIQLVGVATVLAILLGVMVGVVSALRQYTGFDYSITFLSFLLYSLPVFWVAVLAKVFLAIDFNDFLGDPNPQLSHRRDDRRGPVRRPGHLVGRRRQDDAPGCATSRSPLPARSRCCIAYLNLTDFFEHPSFGIVLIALTVGRLGLRGHAAEHRPAQPEGALLRAVGGRLGAVLWLPLLYFWEWADDAGILGWPLIVGHVPRRPGRERRHRARLGRPRPHPIRAYGRTDRDPGLGHAVHRPAAAELGQLPRQRRDQGASDRHPGTVDARTSRVTSGSRPSTPPRTWCCRRRR